MGNRLKEWRVLRGMTMAQLGTALDTDASTINKLEKSTRRLHTDWLRKLCDTLQCSPSDILTDEERLVPVVGYVGAGSEVFIDNQSGDDVLEMIDPPIGVNKNVVAVRIRGNSMYPFREGWILFYTKDCDGVGDDCIRRICVVKRIDGAMFVKEVHHGSRSGMFTLLSWNAPPIEDVNLVWAARVLDIRPT